MPRRRFQTEEIIQELRAAEVLLSQGRNVSEACRKIGVTDQTYYRWRKEYAGTNTFRNDSRRLSTAVCRILNVAIDGHGLCLVTSYLPRC